MARRGTGATSHMSATAAHSVGPHLFPGLAICIPGDIAEEKLDLPGEVDAIHLDEIRKAGLYDKTWQRPSPCCCQCASWRDGRRSHP